ncbi:DNA replication and repair protein RecF [Terrimonas sp. NA20]|uniref:DNA replication and repair protein RecF n=1 Tax=Terrimonas ginsenosidimutans TaxID=2908004 RepID=A0ABS9KMR1_9BACT|nr:DNA replication and repair protein RecF [Terrimonas ginsenosidimutans]MCG2613598.1 DNA replication and repair protein RecF [Terrimonas ginsenosidimutans]
MLRIESLALLQFKNYSDRVFKTPERVIGICGLNGIGKTNLLDAIHYLCFTKSYFSRQDATSVQQGKTGFRIEGQVVLQDKPEKAVCVLRENGKKEFSINGQAYDKFSQHIGRYPCVVIAPDDASLITGSSEERRKFLDSLLSQLDAGYLQQLIVYTKVLQQRNSLLKSFAETGQKDLSLLEVIDQQLIPAGEYVFNKRKEFLVSFLPAVKHAYLDIARQQEELHLFYESELLRAEFPELLRATRQKDLLSQRTATGPHRDDIEISMGKMLFRNIASQGQRKSLLFALKLAEMDVLQQEKHFPPLLLLDDVFEKLDEERIANLLEKVCIKNEGQVFITDTNKERLTLQLEKLGVAFGMIGL